MSESPETSTNLEAHIRALANFSRSVQPEFAPAGDDLAFLSDRGGLPEIWRQALSGDEPPERLSNFPDPVQGIRWSPTGEWLAAQVAPGGGLNSQIHLLPADGSAARQITSGGTTNNWLG